MTSTKTLPAQLTEKPWGCEILWALTDNYAAKLLNVRAGQSLSLQYHQFKEETLLVSVGRVKIEWCEIDEDVSKTEIFLPGDTFHVPPKMKHRIEALEHSQLIEVSTTQLNDVVRIKDNYGRI